MSKLRKRLTLRGRGPGADTVRAGSGFRLDRAGEEEGLVMKCSDIVSKNVERLLERDTLDRVATVMADAQVGFLPVCDADGKVVGVVGDRDLVDRAMAKRLDPKRTTVSEVMTRPVLTCFVDADLHVAEELMHEEGKAHVVLVREDGTLAGVLSLADIIENAPTREAVRTAKSVLWREALGPRGGAAPGQPLLQDEPAPPRLPEKDQPHTHGSVFAMGRRTTDTKEFPS
jgi:CBS domain-containing protein